VKGGDPLVFARSGEEIEKLTEAGIEVEIINGITAGLAACAALNIPLTHRDYAHSITFVTGKSRKGLEPNWNALAQSGSTLVIYMGMYTAQAISERLIAAGLSQHTEAAVIENATLTNERWLITSLGQLSKAIQQASLKSPGIIVVGNVVGLSQIQASEQSVLLQGGGMP
jgi:uroporphyrin-III C-methyltransferase